MTTLILGALVAPSMGAAALEAAGPRQEVSPTQARYSIPPQLLEKPYRFAGEVIPLDRSDVRGRVRSEINFLLFDARSVLLSWLVEKGKYSWIFDEIFGKEGIPKDFTLLAPALSGMSAKSSSKLPGTGWWAIDKPCAKADGVVMFKDTWCDDRLDIELSTKCFASRLKAARKDLGTQSWLLAAAAYVTSTEQIKQLTKKWDSSDYWDIPLPDNAEEMIVRWVALGIIDADKEAFGISARPAAALTYDQVSGLLLTKDLSVADVARFTNTPARHIIQLNPKIKPNAGKFPALVKGQRFSHSVAVPKGSGRLLVQELTKNGFIAEKKGP